MRVIHKGPKKVRERRLMKKAVAADKMVEKVKNSSLAEMDRWIDRHVTDLDSAKQVMKILAKLVRYALVHIDEE